MSKDLTPKMDETTRAKAAEHLAEMVSKGDTAAKCLQVIREKYDHYATARTVIALKRHLRYQEYMNNIAEELKRAKINQSIVILANAAPEIAEALIKQAKKGDVRAATLVFTTIGATEQPEQKQDTKIEIILPGGGPSEKDVTSRDKPIEITGRTET